MAVSAPGRFSTTTGWPKSSLIFCATIRDRMSVGPPAGNGTTMRIGRVGKSCANAGAWSAASTHRAAAIRQIECRTVNIGVLPSAFSRRANLLHPEPDFLGGRRREGILVGDKFGDRGRIKIEGRERKLVEMRAHLGGLVDAPDLGIELAYDAGGQVLRAGKPEPGFAADVGKALLGKSRDVR